MSILKVIHDRNAGMMPEVYKELTEEEMAGRILKIKKKFGARLFIPGHHYQKDEVIQFADATGDSLQLAQVAQKIKSGIYRVLRRTFYGGNSRYAHFGRTDCRFAGHARRLFDGRYGQYAADKSRLGRADEAVWRYGHSAHICQFDS